MKHVRTRSAVVAALCLASVAGIAACGAPTAAGRSLTNPASIQSQAQSRTAIASPSTIHITGAGPAAQSTAPASSRAPQKASADEAHVTVAPARLPGYTVESWTAQAAGPVRAATGHAIELNECATVRGAATWQQTSYAGSDGDSAILETYTFAADSAATTAYDAVLAGMRSCQATSRALQVADHVTPDAVSRGTANAVDAAAFSRTWTGVEGVSAAGRQTNHLYLAMRGTTVLILHFDEPAVDTSVAPYDVHEDPDVLSMLTNVLADQVSAG
ncbi:MAG TPA: hypothetical protein VH372_12735 [Actinospica sp.]|nr:hypothetical protein [Actinospica sp.]